MESQRHGFVFEDYIKLNVFKVEKKYAYNAIHDVRNEDNIFDSTENISIKTATGGVNPTVYFGSPLRIYNYPNDEKHTAIIVLLTQTGDIKNVSRIVEISLDNKKLLFGDIVEEDIRELERLIKEVSKNEKPQSLIRNIHTKKNELNKKSGYMKFNPKIDGKDQRRLQCSIPKFITFIEKNPEIVLYDKKEAFVRGIKIPEFIQSKRRTRRRKDVEKL